MGEPGLLLAFTEGLVLGNYCFLKYFGDKAEKKHPLENILIVSDKLDKQEIDVLKTLNEAVYFVRDMVNEPLSFMNAVQFSETVKQLGILGGFSVEVFNKKKIESLKMGGLLGVNRGSIDPPTFTVMEWMPDNAVNKNPLVLVGKGVVFDTGGLSLKPTQNSMDYMKSDMSGAAAVAGVMYAVARSEIPVKVVGLLPATDNRPDGNAVAPGDVITMYNGMSVEVLNTDAEGRLILADAISYAGKYKPGLIIDIATLTGSAALAIGRFGIVGMGNAESRYMKSLIHSGNYVHERIVEFPFWEEYDKLLESNIADLKNIAERDAGAITAGKFLEKFTGYPLIHLDIAGSAFLKKANSYQGKGATAIGVRLLFDFIRNFPNLFDKDR
ncbi:MAG: leucyl aminopeptidase [Bacteroidetes bacterium]|nr:leucyl aminopeptidase [Bacteroidota bacterium]